LWRNDTAEFCWKNGSNKSGTLWRRKTEVIGLLRLQNPTTVCHVLVGETAKRPSDEFSKSKTEVAAPYGDFRHTPKRVIGSRVCL
jgi:hypothetical protein